VSMPKPGLRFGVVALMLLLQKQPHTLSCSARAVLLGCFCASANILVFEDRMYAMANS